jgi:hypothetical protein
MAKSLVTLLLVATQVASWNAGRLYLCLGRDGSVAIDFGPGFCDSCQPAEAECSCACEHAACPRHEPAACDAAEHAAACQHAGGPLDPCDCLHIQISEPQTAVVKLSAEAARDALASIGLLGLDVASACLAGSPAAVGLFSPAEFLGAGPLALRSSVVLRC